MQGRIAYARMRQLIYAMSLGICDMSLHWRIKLKKP